MLWRRGLFEGQGRIEGLVTGIVRIESIELRK